MHHHLQFFSHPRWGLVAMTVSNLHGLWTNKQNWGASSYGLTAKNVRWCPVSPFSPNCIQIYSPEKSDIIAHSIGVHNLVYLTPPAFSQTRKNCSVFMDAWMQSVYPIHAGWKYPTMLLFWSGEWHAVLARSQPKWTQFSLDKATLALEADTQIA